MILQSILNTVANLVLLVVLPLGGYVIFQRWRRRRHWTEIAERVGLRLGPARYIAYSIVAAAIAVGLLLIWAPPIEALTHDLSPQRRFDGLGLGTTSIVMALLYGVVQTGFCEELLFRGMIAGSLSRRLSLPWANVWQAVIFLLPHLLVLMVAPALWPFLVAVLALALFAGWVRIRSGSIVGPWIMHAAGNVATCLYVAVATVPSNGAPGPG